MSVLWTAFAWIVMVLFVLFLILMALLPILMRPRDR